MDHINFAATLLTLLVYGIFILVGLWLDLTKNLPDEPELHLLPDPSTHYAVIDNILAVVKKSQVGKFGFEGNERYSDAF